MILFVTHQRLSLQNTDVRLTVCGRGVGLSYTKASIPASVLCLSFCPFSPLFVLTCIGPGSF